MSGMNGKTEHKYAQVLRWIADGEAVEIYWAGRWQRHDFELFRLIGEGVATPDMFRVAPKHININGFNVPEPLREWPGDNRKVWVVGFNTITEGGTFALRDRLSYDRALRQGLVHRTEEAARLHREALLSFTTTEK